MKKFARRFLSLLLVRSPAAGLEVSDQVARLVYFDRRVWQMHAVRLEPGILEKGVVKNRAGLVAAFAALKERAQKKKGGKMMNVVVCVSSVASYIQTFSLPVVEGENLNDAIALNLQMASPLEARESYSGWQMIGEDAKAHQVQILGAFVERNVVDGIVDALYEAGFLAIAVESRALALARMLREKGAGIEAGKAYVFVDVGNAGVDFLIVRNGALYFEYAVPWRDLMDEKGEIVVASFEAMFAASVRQVVNFYHRQWAEEPLDAIILSAVALEANAEKAVAEAAVGVPSARLTLVMGQPVSSEWLTALGCSLREQGEGGAGGDHEISLLGDESRDRLRAEQFSAFLRFWRAAIPVSLGFLILIFVGAYILLQNTRSGIESRGNSQFGTGEASTVANLQAQATSFNQLTALVVAAEGSANPKSAMLHTVTDLATASHVTVNHVLFQSFSVPIRLSGSAEGQDAALAFQQALTKNPHVSAVNLPLTEIQTNGTTVTFSITFVYTP